MPNEHNFEHLRLIFAKQGIARLHGGGESNPITVQNKDNRAGHCDTLMKSACSISGAWGERFASRARENLPDLRAGIPLLLKIDESMDVDSLRHFLGFEIISEEDNGFVIVASEDLNLGHLISKINDFNNSVTGSAAVAQIHELIEESEEENRLSRILSDELKNEWASIGDTDDYVVDVSISCSGNWVIPKKPKKGRLKPETWERKLREWNENYETSYIKWDNLREERKDAIGNIINYYGSEIVDEYEQSDGETIPDNFTLRIKLTGKALRDFASNYPYIFEIGEPEDIETPQGVRRQDSLAVPDVSILAAPASAPTVCVIDSGIQENHIWINPAIDTANSFCFVPYESPTDTADYVSNGGHGTRVAGAILYGEAVPTGGTVQLNAWIQNARALDKNCALSRSVLPEKLISQVVAKYHNGDRPTKIFNHSINSIVPHRSRHMSSWAFEMDKLSYRHDILIIQSAGNIQRSGPPNNPGVEELIASGHDYPEYLTRRSCRIANPGQSLQVLTVGSISYDQFSDGHWASFSDQYSKPSAFSRAGFGIWDSIKPEVVEFGGDYLHSGRQSTSVAIPATGSACYPELIRSTLHGGPAFSKDIVGTSFSTPKVSKLAASIQAVLPEESCLIYRALIVQSARWPNWAESLTRDEKVPVLQQIGYGVPDLNRATTNTPYRTTFITSNEYELKAGECHIFQIPIPDRLRSPGTEYQIRLDITLSYSAEPKRTRKGRRGYLSTWLDWETSRKGESIEAFTNRAVREAAKTSTEGQSINWTLGTQGNHGIIPIANRNNGTVQKDWAQISSNELPEFFCIAVRGHQGWNKDPEASAKYVLAVSIENIGSEIEIYEDLRAAVQELQSETEVEMELEVDV